MFEEPYDRLPVPLADGCRMPPGQPPRTAVAAAVPPNPPRRYSADSTVPRRPAPLLLAWWLRDVVTLQLSLCRRSAVALGRSLSRGQRCHPDLVDR